MKRWHVIGRKNSGKTTLIVELVEEFRRLGLNVGTIKHTHHRHELDTPGKDSHRHRQAGAVAVGILSPELNAVFWRDGTRDESDREASEARYETFLGLMADCDVVLVEGDSRTHAPKLEVWRAATNTTPIAAEDPSVAAIVTDDTIAASCPILARSDVAGLANWMLAELERMR